MNKIDEIIQRWKRVRSDEDHPLSSEAQQMLITWFQENKIPV